ncbi:hypothetical protein [Mycoplasmoides pneumoniae]
MRIASGRWGEQVHAGVVLKSGASATPEGLMAHCHTLIAGYKCPRSGDITAAALPLSGAVAVMSTLRGHL